MSQGDGVKGSAAKYFLLRRFRKLLIIWYDGLSLKYLKYGIIGFSDDYCPVKVSLYIFGEALRGMDGKSFRQAGSK